MIGMRRLFFLAIIMLFLVISLVHAGPTEIKTFAIEDSILANGRAVFDIRITNNQIVNDTFRFSYEDVEWDVISDPLHYYFTGVDVPAGSSQMVRIVLTSSRYHLPGRYQVDFTIDSTRGTNSHTFPLVVSIRSEKPRIDAYLAAVKQLVDVPDVVIPKDNVPVTINLVNRNAKNISEMKIVMSSRFMNRIVSTPLGPLEEKIIEESFSLDPLLPPQEDVVNFKFFADGVFLNADRPINEPYKIGAYAEIIVESSDTKKSFLKTTEEKTYRNVGNVKKSEIIEVETNRFESFFTRSEPDQVSLTRGNQFYKVWEITLEPAKVVTVTRTVSYRPLVVIAVILLAGAIFFYLMRSPVSVVKRVSVVHLSGGGISELKIIVHLKNRSGEHFEKFTVVDKIPLMADVKSDHDVGSVKPASVYVHGNQTTVKWDVDKLEKNEERILSYKLKARLPIVGSLSLPGVSARFYSGKGTKLITKSRGVIAKA